MAGLFGFLLRAPRDGAWADRRFAAMRAAMTARDTHRVFTWTGGRVWIGQTGPGILPGSLRLHRVPSGPWLLADGECYHLDHLRTGDEAPGGPWSAIGDRWVRGGAAALRDVDGLFTLVRIDPGATRLRLINDRYGSRRLYVLARDDAFVFASELRPLLVWGGVDVDETFVRQFVCLGAPLDGRTWIAGVRLMPPATEYDATPDSVRSTRYWSWDELPACDDSVPASPRLPGRLAARLLETWDRALAARLGGERVGQMLSGGLDSRLILAGAARRRDAWLAVTYGEPGSDEVRFAREAAAAARVPWLLWALPEPGWLEARTRYCLAHDGVVDIVNAFHATLLDRLGSLMRREVNGYLGDLVLGATYDVDTAEEALRCLPYWHSPIAMPETDALAAVVQSLGARGPRGWLVETKCWRATNAWPHAAVDVLEVRKPFMDYALVELAATIPRATRRARACHRALLAPHPALARVPWQKTGVALDAGPWARWTRRARRLAHRCARHVGVPVRPWTRGAVDLDRWLADPGVAETFRDTLMAASARTARYFDRTAVEATLEATLRQRSVAHEPLLHLYLAERILGQLGDGRAGS